MKEGASVVLCIPAKCQPQLAKSGHVAVIVPQAQSARTSSLNWELRRKTMAKTTDYGKI